jgi:hypothetical protein
MRYSAILTVIAVAATPGAMAVASEAPAVAVTYVAPESFVDSRLYRAPQQVASEPVLRELSAHLEDLGRRTLKPGDVLRVEIRDIDLAGRIVYGAGGSTRVMDRLSWPRIALGYVLERVGAPALRGEEIVADETYLNRHGKLYPNAMLPYEKRMLDHWFKARFEGK